MLDKIKVEEESEKEANPDENQDICTSMLNVIAEDSIATDSRNMTFQDESVADDVIEKQIADEPISVTLERKTITDISSTSKLDNAQTQEDIVTDLNSIYLFQKSRSMPSVNVPSKNSSLSRLYISGYKNSFIVDETELAKADITNLAVNSSLSHGSSSCDDERESSSTQRPTTNSGTLNESRVECDK